MARFTSCRVGRRAGVNEWARERFTAVANNDDLVDDDDESPTHEPASGPNQPPVDAPPPAHASPSLPGGVVVSSTESFRF